jgi:small-conductance mechanosensitive channel
MSEDDLAQRLEEAMTRSTVPKHDQTLIAGIMRSIAPYLKALQDQIDALQGRLDDLER